MREELGMLCEVQLVLKRVCAVYWFFIYQQHKVLVLGAVNSENYGHMPSDDLFN